MPGLYMTPAKPLPPLVFVCRAAAALMLAALLVSCGESQKQGGAPPPPAVTVAKPVKRMLSDYDEYVGRFTAVDSVEVRARVSGYLDTVDFKDGQIVKQGDLLFTIDKRPFQNTLDQARANLEQAKSNLIYTKSDLDRGQQLVRDKTITDQTFEQRAQAYRNAQASVSANQAAVRQAELDLEFTELRAPITGRIGDRRVSPGNLVTGGTTGNTTLLATIVSIDPIRFEFTFDEASFLRYERCPSSAATSPAAAPACSRAQAHRRKNLRSRRSYGFYRQCDRQLDRHHPRPSAVRQCQRPVYAGHVRPHPRAGLAALRGVVGSRCRDRHRAGAQICSRRRAPTIRSSRNT